MHSTQNKIQEVVDNIDNGFARKLPRKCIINPCETCKKSITKSQKEIQCSICLRNHHLKCNDLTVDDYEIIKNKGSDWTCIICVLSFNLKHFPFTRLQNTEIINMNDSNTMKFLDTIPSHNIVDETTRISSIKLSDITDDLPSKSNSKY